MFDYTKIRAELEDFITDFPAGMDDLGDYDVDGMMDYLRAMDPDVESISDVYIYEIIGAFDLAHGGKGADDLYRDHDGSSSIYYDDEANDWKVFTGDPASPDYTFGAGDVDRDAAVQALLRFDAQTD